MNELQDTIDRIDNPSVSISQMLIDDGPAWQGFIDDLEVIVDAARRVANGEETYRCSQHGYRGTPRCNDNSTCTLQRGVWVGITTEDDE